MKPDAVTRWLASSATPAQCARVKVAIEEASERWSQEHLGATPDQVSVARLVAREVATLTEVWRVNAGRAE